jgi:hypothetical protein
MGKVARIMSANSISSFNSPLTVEIIWCTWGKEYMPYSSSTFTLPSVQIFERSFLTRSTTITFSERSLALSFSSSLCLSSARLSAILFDVPFIGCDKIVFPCFFKKRSGLAQSKYLPFNL